MDVNATEIIIGDERNYYECIKDSYAVKSLSQNFYAEIPDTLIFGSESDEEYIAASEEYITMISGVDLLYLPITANITYKLDR